MSDREGYVEPMEYPEGDQKHPMSSNWPAFDDGRARSKTELEYFYNDQGAKLGLSCREPMRGTEGMGYPMEGKY